jgi:two-component system, NarL family, nitrate/nitrite response regulator NarL
MVLLVKALRCWAISRVAPLLPMNKRKKKIRVLLVDDHPVVRKGIRTWLTGLESVEVADEAVNGLEAIAKVKELSPDIVLMDVDMPKLSGLEATKVIRKDFPSTRVLILSGHTNKSVVLQIIQSGAQGYVLKDAPPADILRAIESVDKGEPFFSADISQIVLNQYLAESGADQSPTSAKLTNRERQVLAMIAEGQSNKEMASKLGVGVRTIETHRERMMAKLDIHTVAGLTKYAITNGIVNL